ncbi:16S rRNA (guanine(966)-N(2))-methyltransferase RsmD [Blastomonas sp.]|uniref:16S rRNA (guanine(966)-N(2))-methyltransferase RsmD n=1 Tax=Blastomonas sp. TaxID=1909299 RepID=UPI0035947B4F
MRIIAGQWRGRKIRTPAGDTTRPTADRVRETLFSMVTSRLGSFDELSVLDLFAGSGALGLEALSRGAERCTFVEHDRPAIDVLRANIALLDAGARTEVRSSSALALGPALKPFDVVMMDPPYGSGAGSVALDKLGWLGWFSPSCWISVETGSRETVAVSGFTVEAERIVGKAKLTILRPAADVLE